MKPEYVLAYTTTGHILAESIVTLLKSFGIDAFTSQESAGMAYGLTVGALGEARIYVPENQLEDAQRLLEQMERGELQISTPNEDNPTDEGPLEGDSESK
ncbi:DUF2007 domain-containing protein [bacterium]|nr:MAG: DUF2007 domain-containing protein [bacterium]